MRIAAVAILGLVSLAACDRPAADKGEAAGPETAAPGVAAAPAERALRPIHPVLKAGLWSLTTTIDGVEQRATWCVDAAMQQRMSIIGAEQQAGTCQQNAASPMPGGGFGFEAVCAVPGTGGGKMTARGQITGDLSTGYVQRSTTVTTGYPVAHMNRTVETTTEGRYEGACPAGMRAGDMDTPGGRFNTIDMAAGAARETKPAP